MYELVSTISFIIRFYLGYKTVETIPIFENHLFNSIWAEAIPTYTILWAISFFITGIFYEKGRDHWLKGCILYFAIHCLLLLLIYLVLLLLSHFSILPIK